VHAVEELIASDVFLAALRDSLALNGPPPLLRCAKIKITSRCNLRCRMCRYGRPHDEETVSAARWSGVLSELAALGCRKVHFSGGEVFLRRDFLELIETARTAGLKVTLTTNGTLLSKECAHRLDALGVNGVSLSLDGPTAKVHDAIRGVDGAFKRTVRAIRQLRRHARDAKVRLNFVVMRYNYRCMPEMVRLASDLGVEELLPMPVDEKGARKHRLSASRIREYNQVLAPRVLDLRREHGFSTHPLLVYPFGVTDKEIRDSAKGRYARGFFKSRFCLAPWLHLFLAWNGDAFPCCMTNGREKPLGNIARQSVRDVFHGSAYDKLRRRFSGGSLLKDCRRCDLFLLENAKLHAALERSGRDQGDSHPSRSILQRAG
jgi:MoaA/NifB/PqqE/SkfB family radical SAM enzyme